MEINMKIRFHNELLQGFFFQVLNLRSLNQTWVCVFFCAWFQEYLGNYNPIF